MEKPLLLQKISQSSQEIETESVNPEFGTCVTEETPIDGKLTYESNPYKLLDITSPRTIEEDLKLSVRRHLITNFS